MRQKATSLVLMLAAVVACTSSEGGGGDDDDDGSMSPTATESPIAGGSLRSSGQAICLLDTAATLSSCTVYLSALVNDDGTSLNVTDATVLMGPTGAQVTLDFPGAGHYEGSQIGLSPTYDLDITRPNGDAIHDVQVAAPGDFTFALTPDVLAVGSPFDVDWSGPAGDFDSTVVINVSRDGSTRFSSLVSDPGFGTQTVPETAINEAGTYEIQVFRRSLGTFHEGRVVFFVGLGRTKTRVVP